MLRPLAIVSCAASGDMHAALPLPRHPTDERVSVWLRQQSPRDLQKPAALCSRWGVASPGVRTSCRGIPASGQADARSQVAFSHTHPLRKSATGKSSPGVGVCKYNYVLGGCLHDKFTQPSSRTARGPLRYSFTSRLHATPCAASASASAMQPCYLSRVGGAIAGPRAKVLCSRPTSAVCPGPEPTAALVQRSLSFGKCWLLPSAAVTDGLPGILQGLRNASQCTSRCHRRRHWR